MPSSYFDVQLSKAPPPSALLDVPEGSNIARTSLLSPQVSRILDELDLGEKSSSGDEEDSASLSENSDLGRDTDRGRKSHPNKTEENYSIRKTQTSPLAHGKKSPKDQKPAASSRPGLNAAKQPHFARLHSLRSMLFSSRIEHDMREQMESREQEQAEAKWRAEHDSRKGLNRPKTPPEGQTPSKEGLGKRMKMGLRRLTSKEGPKPMKQIPEDNVSTASDDEEDENEANHSDHSRIDHSDIEDIVRWVSRRDPPSDGEARKVQSGEVRPVSRSNSGHENLGDSDIDELLQWVSRRNDGQPKASRQDIPQAEAPHGQHPLPRVTDAQHRYSDASTASDSEDLTRRPGHKGSIDDQDVDELVRWVSHREGPNAGPVREQKPPKTNASTPSTSESEPPNPQAEELARWMSKADDASGESLPTSQDSLPQETPHLDGSNRASAGGSRLKREVSHTQTPPESEKQELTEGDVEYLVQWVSQRNTGIRNEETKEAVKDKEDQR